MLAGEQCRRVVHRADGDATGQPCDHLLSAQRARPALDHLGDERPVDGPPIGAAGARIVDQIGPPHHVAKEPPLPSGRRSDGAVAVDRRVQLERSERRVLGPPWRLHLAGVGVAVGERLAERHHGIGHGDIDELPVACGPGVVQRTEHTDRAHRRRIEVADARAGRHQLPAGLAGVADEAAHGLGHDVEGRPAGVGALAGAGIAEAADGGVDELRVAGVQRLVAEAEPVHHAARVVLDEHVRGVNQCEQRVPVCGTFEVEHDAALVAVDATEVAAVEAVGVRLRVGVVEAGHVAGRRFDLDDVGPHVGEDHRAVRSGQGLGEVDDTDVGKRARPTGLHRRGVLVTAGMGVVHPGGLRFRHSGSSGCGASRGRAARPRRPVGLRA